MSPMNNALRAGLLGACVVTTGMAPAHAEADAHRGATVFATQCAECHSMKEGKDGKGPSLFAVLGRKAASNPGFVYSAAMKDSGIVWTPDRLQAYVTNPRKALPGGKMKFDGMDDAQEINDLLAYLAKSGH